MKNTLSTLIGVIIFYFIVPVVLGVIVVKLFISGNGMILSIIFIGLIVLEIIAAIIKLIKYNKNK